MVYDVRTSARSRSGVLVSSLAVVAALEKYLKKYYIINNSNCVYLCVMMYFSLPCRALYVWIYYRTLQQQFFRARKFPHCVPVVVFLCKTELKKYKIILTVTVRPAAAEIVIRRYYCRVAKVTSCSVCLTLHRSFKIVYLTYAVVRWW